MASNDPADAQLWDLIEAAWLPRGKSVNAARAALAVRDVDDDDDEDVDAMTEAIAEVVTALEVACQALPQDQLVGVDRALERRLYEIDRAEIQEVTDGSDDGFLYARGFIVAMGKAFFDAVHDNPALAIPFAECEDICYLPAHVHEARFGAFPEHASGISRESCSNGDGWPER